MALFTQGGSGFEYKNLDTSFGTRDKLLGLLSIGKLSPSVAVELNPKLSVGASLAIVYSDLRQDIFKNTSFVDPTDPSRSFFGYKTRNMNGINPGLRVGMQYRFNEHVTLGAAYSTKTELDMTDGRLTMNFSALGLGNVRYRDAEFKGLNLAQELGVGLAVQATPKLLLAAEVNWLDWSDAVDSATLKASRPDNPAAPPTVTIPTTFDWRDQWVVGLGMEYAVSDRTHLRAGYNYGRNPVPSEHLTPLAALIGEHHFILGASHRTNHGWQFETAVQYEPHTEQTYSNPATPFGPGAREEREIVILHFTLSRLW